MQGGASVNVRGRSKYLIFDIEAINSLIKFKTYGMSEDLIVIKSPENSENTESEKVENNEDLINNSPGDNILKDGAKIIKLLNDLIKRGYEIVFYSSTGSETLKTLSDLKFSCEIQALTFPHISAVVVNDPKYQYKSYGEIKEKSLNAEEISFALEQIESTPKIIGLNKKEDPVKFYLRYALSSREGLNIHPEDKHNHLILDAKSNAVNSAKKEGYDAHLIRSSQDIIKQLHEKKYEPREPKIIGESRNQVSSDYNKILVRRNELAIGRKNSWFFKTRKEAKINFLDKMLDFIEEQKNEITSIKDAFNHAKSSTPAKERELVVAGFSSKTKDLLINLNLIEKSSDLKYSNQERNPVTRFGMFGRLSQKRDAGAQEQSNNKFKYKP